MTAKKINFQKLTPINNVELSIYEDALNFVFENSDVRNIAISGSYGAGKSSLLESYKEKKKEKKFIHISLAHFIPDEEVLELSKSEVTESSLEGKILNQLIHQISPDKIPQTNFKVKTTINRNDIFVTTLLISLFFLMVLHIYTFSNWVEYILILPQNLLKSILWAITPLLLFGSIIGSSALGIYFLFTLLKKQKNQNIFKKINFQGNEIEIFEDSKDSYFDKYLNEVLYLFENLDVDVVVFEDIDRFKNNKKFERLHEINQLSNIQLDKGNKTLRFFYLLRDDIFISKDRTKFFDFIIPVIPVIDGSNSYDQFINYFEGNQILEDLDKNFLQELSLYIDDMRILKNIHNEFLIYNHRLNTTELDCNKMLAIIVRNRIISTIQLHLSNTTELHA